MSSPSDRNSTSSSTGTHHYQHDDEQKNLLEARDKNDLHISRSASTASDSVSNSGSGISDVDEYYSYSENGERGFFQCMKNISTADIIKYIKYAGSLYLLSYVIRMIFCGIYAVETPVAQVLSPFAALAFMWMTLIWLMMLEGGQGCLVGLQPIDKAAYLKTHPISHRCVGMVPDNETLNRFIVGRQFFVVLMIYALNLCCSVVENAVVPGFPNFLIETVLASGLAVMLITVVVGQLSAEVTATNCMLDFINSRALLVTTWLCLAIESSGILHSVYLVRMFLKAFLGKGDDDSTETSSEKKSIAERTFYWVRVISSLIILTYVMIVCVAAILSGKSTMYEGVNNYFTLALFIFLIGFLGMCEAMQIALFAVVNMSDKFLEENLSARGKRNNEIVFTGDNFRAFLIGRQICVTMSMFWLAKLTTTDVNPEYEGTVLGISNAAQDFFDSGLPGALITTIVASVAWRVIASTFPVEFMGNIMVYPFIRLCLFLEATGVFSSSWLLADILKKVTRFQHDEVYLGDLVGGKSGHSHEKDVEDTTTSITDSYDNETLSLIIGNEDSNTSKNTDSNYGSTTTSSA